MIELNPQYAKAYNNCGIAYEKLNQNEKAIESYQFFLRYADPKTMAKVIELTQKQIVILKGGK